MLVVRRAETSQGWPGFHQSGHSAQGPTMDPKVREVVDGFRSQAYWSAVRELIEAFEAGHQDRRCDRPVDARAFSQARALLETLPKGFEVPEVGVDPDGEVALDWIRPDRTMVSVSLGPSRISYAAHLRGSTAHGELHLVDGFPPALIDLLRQLYFPL